jgi:DNA polymerase III subunit epsilon
VKLEALELPVLFASDEELAAHQSVLDGLDKAVKGTSVWRLEPAAPVDANADAQTA